MVNCTTTVICVVLCYFVLCCVVTHGRSNSAYDKVLPRTSLGSFPRWYFSRADMASSLRFTCCRFVYIIFIYIYDVCVGNKFVRMIFTWQFVYEHMYNYPL